MRRLVSALAFLAALVLVLPARAGGGLRVSVLVPEKSNLQYAQFWIALGGDFFSDEGFDIDLVVPNTPRETEALWQTRKAEFAVMPAAVYGHVVERTHGDLSFLTNMLTRDPAAKSDTGTHVFAAFVTTPMLVDRERWIAIGLVRALMRASRLVHDAPKDALAILERTFPDRDRTEVAQTFNQVAPLIPTDPGFPWIQISKSATFYADYADGMAPRLDGIDLTKAVAYEIINPANEKPQPNHVRFVMLCAVCVIAGMAALGWYTKDRTKLLRS